jgi:hypothetical protein
MDAVFAAAASCGLMIIVFAIFAIALLRPARRGDAELERLRAEVGELRRNHHDGVGT